MSSIEGMWQMQTGSAGAPLELKWGGIVVLETGRIFGGDSARAYTGNYEVLPNQRLAAYAKSWLWNVALAEEFQTVFGDDAASPHQVECLLDIQDGNLLGYIWRTDAPNQKLAIQLLKIAELPN